MHLLRDASLPAAQRRLPCASASLHRCTLEIASRPEVRHQQPGVHWLSIRTVCQPVTQAASCTYLGHHGPPQPHAGEAGILGEGAGLDAALLSACGRPRGACVTVANVGWAASLLSCCSAPPCTCGGASEPQHPCSLFQLMVSVLGPAPSSSRPHPRSRRWWWGSWGPQCTGRRQRRTPQCCRRRKLWGWWMSY